MQREGCLVVMKLRLDCKNQHLLRHGQNYYFLPEPKVHVNIKDLFTVPFYCLMQDTCLDRATGCGGSQLFPATGFIHRLLSFSLLG